MGIKNATNLYSKFLLLFSLRFLLFLRTLFYLQHIAMSWNVEHLYVKQIVGWKQDFNRRFELRMNNECWKALKRFDERISIYFQLSILYVFISVAECGVDDLVLYRGQQYQLHQILRSFLNFSLRFREPRWFWPFQVRSRLVVGWWW